MNNKAKGFRGYIGTRSYHGLDFPQNIQNFLIRNYCQKNQMVFLLSGTEYTMPGCYMILEEILGTISSLEGIVLFSIFMLPESSKKRKEIYEKILKDGKTLHAALEDIVIRKYSDIQIVEDILNLQKIALENHALNELRDFCIA